MIYCACIYTCSYMFYCIHTIGGGHVYFFFIWGQQTPSFFRSLQQFQERLTLHRRGDSGVWFRNDVFDSLLFTHKRIGVQCGFSCDVPGLISIFRKMCFYFQPPTLPEYLYAVYRWCILSVSASANLELSHTQRHVENDVNWLMTL